MGRSLRERICQLICVLMIVACLPDCHSAEIPSDWPDLISDDVYEYTINKASKKASGAFEGDMGGVSASQFVQDNGDGPVAHDAVRDESRRWINRTIPYALSRGSFKNNIGHRKPKSHLNRIPSSREEKLIVQALHDTMSKTCLQFVPRTSHFDYINFVSSAEGCFSAVGRQGGKQSVHVEKGCTTLLGEIQHEVMHALGFYHEQSRWDRDNYVVIFERNIESSELDNFLKYKWTTFNLPYDYESIMHYPFDAFSVGDGRPTILPKKKAPIGNRKVMSAIDVQKVNMLYGCTEMLPTGVAHRLDVTPVTKIPKTTTTTAVFRAGSFVESFDCSGRTFKISSRTAAYSEASRLCIRSGGSLAVLKRKRTAECVMRNLDQRGFNETGFMWFGLTRIGPNNDDFQWADGKHLGENDYTNWWAHVDSSEPINAGGNEFCVHMLQVWGEERLRYKWNDADCTFKYGFICETP